MPRKREKNALDKFLGIPTKNIPLPHMVFLCHALDSTATEILLRKSEFREVNKNNIISPDLIIAAAETWNSLTSIKP